MFKATVISIVFIDDEVYYIFYVENIETTLDLLDVEPFYEA